jgi:hypothetical protein
MSALPPVVGESSPIDAAHDAWEHTRRVLFPFRFELWLGLGALAFLDQCGQSGGGGGFPSAPPVGWNGPAPSGSGGGPGSDAAADVRAWLLANVGMIAAVGGLALAIVVGMVALALWIGSRATFVYIDAVVTGRPELSAPWKRHAAAAHSLFLWRLGLFGAVGVVLVVMLLLLAGVILLGAGGSPGAASGLAVLLVLVVPLFFLVLVASGLLSLALRDFAAPLQVHGGLSCGEALRVLRDLVRTWPLAFILYVVLKLVFAILQGIMIMLAMCFTCCLALIPVVVQTILQPLFFFERAWSLHLLRRMGYDVLAPREPAGSS